MFTTGTDITTAVTDLVNVVVATFLMCRHIKAGVRKKRDVLWVIAFVLFIMVSVTGFCIHGLTAFSEYGINQVLRRILMVEMAFMLTFYNLAILCDVFGEAIVPKALPVCLVLATVFSAVAVAMMHVTSWGFVIFVVYCVANLLGILAVLIRHRNDKEGLKLYVAAVVLLITANVVQTIKSIQFNLVWDFNYDAVYHWILLLFLLVQHAGIRRLGDSRTA